MKRTKQSTFAKRERSEKSTGFAPVGSEAMIHKHTYSIPSADDQNDVRCIECGQLQPTTHTAKHTPGPWVVSIGPPEHVKVSPHRTRIIPDPATGRDLIIATAEYGAYGPRNPVEAQANAHLIAAAPAMYEALLLVLDDFGGDYKGPTIDAVRAALAQADGKQ